MLLNDSEQLAPTFQAAENILQVRTAAVVASVPRTAWAVSWGMRTGLAYARCMAAHTVCPYLIIHLIRSSAFRFCKVLMSWSHDSRMCLSVPLVACNAPDVAEPHACVPQDHSTEAYQADLSLLHKASARRLRQLCQSNAGIYIKAAQLMSTAQAIPQEYRKCVSQKLQGSQSLLSDPGPRCHPAHTSLSLMPVVERVFDTVLTSKSCLIYVSRLSTSSLPAGGSRSYRTGQSPETLRRCSWRSCSS